MTSIYYFTGARDNGGVHYNSGVNNKAVFLMVDGGSFNGKTVTALNWVNTGDIYYEAQTNLLTSASDYSDLYLALQQACTNLIGVGTLGITSNDCAVVQDAVDAVEMNGQPEPNYNSHAPLCEVGVLYDTIFFDDMESGTGNWEFGAQTGVNHWQYDSPYGPFAASGLYMLYADDTPDEITDTYVKMKSSVPIPAGS